MRVFQVGNIYASHLDRMKPTLDNLVGYEETHAAILGDVAHAQLLSPAADEAGSITLCFPQYLRGLRQWAREKGLSEKTEEDDILLAQVEEHRTEVFYSINATRHSAAFLKRMPGTVRLLIGWLGSPIVGDTFPHYHAVVSNFPSINARHAEMGLSTHYLTPSYETQTDRIPDRPWTGRMTDLFFAGTYSRHHQRRAQLLELVADEASERTLNADLRLLPSRFTALAERTPLGLFPPFSHVRRPRSVRHFSKLPVFGREMFGLFADSKIVMNMAIDMAGSDRGNMRCFEAMSAGSLMISDEGTYPDGFEPGETHLVYRDVSEAISIARSCLNDPEKASSIAAKGATLMRYRYSKARQWADFQSLCAGL